MLSTQYIKGTDCVDNVKSAATQLYIYIYTWFKEALGKAA